MHVKKILNNNVVTTNNENGQEVIIMGNGIGWNLKPGDLIDENKIEKTFTMDTATSTARLKQLFCEVRIESITLHLVNAEYDGNMTRTENMIDIVNDILNIVSLSLKIKLDQDSLDYQRFVTHLLFFAQRVLDHKSLESQDDILYETMSKCYPKEIQCAKKIAEYVEKQYGVATGKEEITFLTVHIAERKILRSKSSGRPEGEPLYTEHSSGEKLWHSF